MERWLSSTANVPASPAIVRKLLMSDPGAVLADRQVPALSRRFRVDLRVDADGGPDAVQPVDIEIGLPRSANGRFPLSWEPAGSTKLLSAFHGTINVVRDSDPDGARLEVSGSYRSPVGRFGAFADGLRDHRRARRSLNRFETEMADRLGNPARRQSEAAGVRPIVHSVSFVTQA
jgi:hypothetical protein